MAIAVRHVFEPTDDGVFDPEEHRRLADDFPAGKLPGVRSVTLYRNIDQQIMVGEAILENKDVLESWENWNNSPERKELFNNFSRGNWFTITQRKFDKDSYKN